jgi:sensor histidine kinase YesM
MNHPFIKNKNLIIYTFLWVLLWGLFTFALDFFYELSFAQASIDSLVFNLLFYGVGLAYWFNVRYSSLGKAQLFNLIISHLAAAAVSVTVIIFLSQTLLKSIYSEDYYMVFLKDSMPWRAALGLLYYAIINLVYYLILYYNDLNEKSIQQSELESMLKSSELEMLKSQINPHFIFNSLNSISSLTIISPEKAREMIVKLSDFLRYSLGKENDQMNTLKDEVKNILLYLDIEKVRFGERLKISTDISDLCAEMLLPNLILQPLFENAIKHGIYESLEKIHIELKATCESGVLKVSVSNEYDAQSVSKKGKGIGLNNIKERLKLIYGSGQGVFIHKSDRIFTVKLEIPQLNE